MISVQYHYDKLLIQKPTMKKERYKFIGNKIKQAREESGMSQKDLAEIVGYGSPTAISLIESGEREVAADMLDKIAQALHHDVNFFLGKETPKPDLLFALRADKKISREDEKTILSFVEYVKSKRK